MRFGKPSSATARWIVDGDVYGVLGGLMGSRRIPRTLDDHVYCRVPVGLGRTIGRGLARLRRATGTVPVRLRRAIGGGAMGLRLPSAPVPMGLRRASDLDR